MTIGIYALYWEEQDLIYIGQSQNIERRFKEHLHLLNKCSHTNYKVQDTYSKFGNPELVILEYCSIERLNDLEIYYTKEFDSINKGLNIIEAGLVGWGVNSNASKYTKRQVLKVFSLLYKGNLSYIDIAKRVQVNNSLIRDIVLQRTHLWLEVEFPDKYAIMLNIECKIRYTNNSKYKANPILMKNCKTQEVVTVFDVSAFVKKYLLEKTHVYKVITGKRRSHKGWVLVSNSELD